MAPEREGKRVRAAFGGSPRIILFLPITPQADFAHSPFALQRLLFIPATPPAPPVPGTISPEIPRLPRSPPPEKFPVRPCPFQPQADFAPPSFALARLLLKPPSPKKCGCCFRSLANRQPGEFKRWRLEKEPSHLLSVSGVIREIVEIERSKDQGFKALNKSHSARGTISQFSSISFRFSGGRCLPEEESRIGFTCFAILRRQESFSAGYGAMEHGAIARCSTASRI